MKKLPRQFYTRGTLLIAEELLGKYLVRRIGKKKLIGKIVETEAYIGPKDRASHAYGGKITPRNKTKYLEGGRIYIYLCYGMHWQLNIVTSVLGKPECVLIRALEPVSKIENLANGPGKLCRWMKLDKSFDGEILIKSRRIWLENPAPGKVNKFKIVKAKRIGIDYAGTWKDKLWRFYIKDNPFISRK